MKIRVGEKKKEWNFGRTEQSIFESASASEAAIRCRAHDVGNRFKSKVL